MTQERQDTRAALAERLAEMAQRYAKAGGHWDVVKDLQDAVALLTASDAREPQPAEPAASALSRYCATCYHALDRCSHCDMPPAEPSRVREALEQAFDAGGRHARPWSSEQSAHWNDDRAKLIAPLLAALSPSPMTEQEPGA
jgi:hypothetical protein